MTEIVPSYLRYRRESEYEVTDLPTEVDHLQTDRLVEDIARALKKHSDATVMTGNGGHRALFPAEAERVARVALRIIGEHLAQVAEPPFEDSMASDEDLTRYGGRQEAATEIRALTVGAWNR